MKRNDEVKGIFYNNGISGNNLNYVTPVYGTSTGVLFYLSGGTEYEINSGGTAPKIPVLISIVITGATSVKTGTTTNYKATATYTDASTAVVTTASTWTVSNNGLVASTIGAKTGVLTSGSYSGTTVLTATITNDLSQVITTTYNVNVTY